MKQYRWLIAVAISACLVCMTGSQMFAEVIEPKPVLVAFANPVGVAQAMDARPTVAVAILLANITQDQADAIEAALFPEPSDAKLRADLVAWHEQGLKLGRPVDDTTLVALACRSAQPQPGALARRRIPTSYSLWMRRIRLLRATRKLLWTSP